MTNEAPYIRKAIVAALSGLQYLTDAVPVFDTEGSGNDKEVIIGETTRADRSNKARSQGNYTQLIEVCSVQVTGYKKIVDGIGQLVIDALKPSVNGIGLTLDQGTLVRISEPSTNYLVEPSGSNRVIVRLILRCELIISE